jgi:tryptophan halogenase
MMENGIRRVVIVGGGTAGWMTAAALARVLGQKPGLEIILVESDEIGTVGVGESTIPQITLFNAMLGIDEPEFVRETHATYKMGIEFVDWTRIGDRFVHPFGFYGLDMMGVEFHHFWLKGRTLGDTTPLADYSLAITGAKASRFAHPRPDLPNSPLSKIGYAFQFDAGLYARFLRRRAEAGGVRRVEGRIVDVAKTGESGLVEAVVLQSGERVEGDLFVDCSGFRGLLIEAAMGSGFEDWTSWLPCDRAFAVPCESNGDRQPMTRATARGAGWQWRIPLQHRTGNGYVYSSAHLSDDEAAATLLANLDGAPLADPKPLRFTAGHRKRAWIGNVVALGLAGGFLEPLESTSIHLVQSGIARLLALWPTRAFDQVEIDRFNMETEREYTDIRDFLVLHYRASERDDTPFWDYCRVLPAPPGLAEKLAMFRSNGRIFREHNELFTETSWLAVLVGKGITPGGYHPAADVMPDSETLDRLRHIRQVVRETAAAMPLQEDYLRDIGCDLTPLRRTG